MTAATLTIERVRVIQSSAPQRGREGHRWTMTVELLGADGVELSRLSVDEAGDGGCLRVFATGGGHMYDVPALKALRARMEQDDPDGFEQDSVLWQELYEVERARRKHAPRCGKVRACSCMLHVSDSEIRVARATDPADPHERPYLAWQPAEIAVETFLAAKRAHRARFTECGNCMVTIVPLPKVEGAPTPLCARCSAEGGGR